MMSMRAMMWTVWIPIGLSMIASIISSFAPTWLLLAFIVPALCLMAVGLGHLMTLNEEFEEALGLWNKWWNQRRRCG